jgi:hypothetical protein
MRLSTLSTAAVGAACLAVAFAACGPAGDPVLTLRVNPISLAADGTTAEVTVEATLGDGRPGTGDVAVTARVGSLGGGGTGIELSLVDGKAATTYACDLAVEPGCSGPVRLAANWKERLAATNVVLPGSAPVSDGGVDGGAGGDAGTDTGTDAGVAGGRKVALAASKATILLEVGDYAQLTATVTNLQNAPLDGQEVTFTTTAGELIPVSGGAGGQSITANTNAQGQASVRLQETAPTPATATVTATDTTSQATVSTQVAFLAVQQVTYVSTLCNGAACNIMGIKTSGFNEQAQVTFRVLDANSKPAVGIPVSFEIATPPGGVYDPTTNPGGMNWLRTTLTNAKGEATTNVTSGIEIGVFAVKAIVLPGRVEVTGPSIGVRGAKASNNGFSFQCLPVNQPAYVSASPPRLLTVNCTVGLSDRYNNPVGSGTSVSFKTEAGSMPAAVATKAFSTSSTAGEGTATVSFSTGSGAWPAWDVMPFAADPGQQPFPRGEEPRILAGTLVRNPRDGLVTLLAYVRGEEHFYDNNKNGVRDANERFIDQGEAFVDANDNNVWDTDELWIDDAPANGVYDGPNGVWDADKTIWTVTHLLYTDRASPATSVLEPDPWAEPCACVPAADGGTTCTGGLPRGSTINVHAWMSDLHLNQTQAGTTYGASHTATKGTVSWKSGNMLDGYGFEIERRRLDAATDAECTSASSACVWKTLFYGWGRGYAGYAEVKGAALTDKTACQPDELRVTSTLSSVATTATAAGAME